MLSKGIPPLGNFSPAFSLKAWQCLVVFLIFVFPSVCLLTLLSIEKITYGAPEEVFVLIFVLLWHPLIALCDFGNQFCAVRIRYEMKSSCPAFREEGESLLHFSPCFWHRHRNHPRHSLGQQPKERTKTADPQGEKRLGGEGGKQQNQQTSKQK